MSDSSGKKARTEATRRKSDFLGENYSTASYRLKQRFLFSLIQKLGLDICFRCEGKMLSSEDFSLDHKDPWFEVSTAKFWDLSNLAFSHKKCNRPHVSGMSKKTHCPKGHLLEGENLGRDNRGHRVCLTCKRDTNREFMREARRNGSNGRTG